MSTHSAREAGRLPSSLAATSDLLPTALSSLPLGLQPGDRIESLHAHRPGTAVKVYADGSACVCWDDGEPQEAGLGHERIPRDLLVKVAGQGDAGQPTGHDVISGAEAAFNDAPAPVEADAEPADTANLRRVDAQLKVSFGGRVFDVSQAGVSVGDEVMCTPAPIAPFIWVRKVDATRHPHMATMLQPIETEALPLPPDPGTTHRRQYLLERLELVLEHAEDADLDGIGAALQKMAEDLAGRRYVPDFVAADYDLTYRFMSAGGVQ